MQPARANGLPAFATYRRDAADAAWQAMSLQLIEIAGDRIASVVAFLDPSLFARFGLPDRLPPGA